MRRQGYLGDFSSPTDLNDFVTEVRRDLNAAGFHAAAGQLMGIQAAAFTTGSEWLGELRRVVLETRFGNVLSKELEAKVDRILKAIA
jgi:hypothetical protein